jgi:hypothetical protein
MTQGSWANWGELLRRDPVLSDRLRCLGRNPALMDTGLFDAAAVDRLTGNHLARRADHRKLLLELLTVTSWLEQLGYTDVAHGG